MENKLQVTRVSDLAEALREKGVTVKPLSEEALEEIKETAEYGVALHSALGIAPPDSLPINIHPEYLLAMIHEIFHHRRKKADDDKRED